MLYLTYETYKPSNTSGWGDWGWVDVPCRSKKDVDVKPEDMKDFQFVKFTISRKVYQSDFDKNGLPTTQSTMFAYSMSSESNTATSLFSKWAENLTHEDIADILNPIRQSIEDLQPDLLRMLDIEAGFDFESETEMMSVGYPIPFLMLEANQYLLASRVMDLIVEKFIELYEALPD